MNVPADLQYTKSDEWVRYENNIATIGITDYAQSQLSDIVFVEILPGTNENIEKGKTCATVESVKAAADVAAPISGKVVASNEKLAGSPELINADPYGEAWMLKIEFDPSADYDLMNAADYEAYCANRGH